MQRPFVGGDDCARGQRLLDEEAGDHVRTTHTLSSWQGLALPSTSFDGQGSAAASKLVDPKAKHRRRRPTSVGGDDGGLQANRVSKFDSAPRINDLVLITDICHQYEQRAKL